ncbi:MAG TPA: glycosyltransferase [Bacteroidales bacterium]|nr:glycosyltransferase [Bacteroidales bacterium]
MLVCPLDWGLGHATRCLPVINVLLRNGCRVVVAADGKPFDFLYGELSEKVEFRRFGGEPVKYPVHGSMLAKLAIQIPGFLRSICIEHKKLITLISKTGASVVISDNRYGLWNKKTRTVFITHQLNIQIPTPLRFLQPFTRWVVRKLAQRYDFCWVPDAPLAPGLSGNLSHLKPPGNVRYVGILSRFSQLKESDFTNPLPKSFPDNFFCAIISGPEPQRSIFEEIISNQFERSGLPAVLVLGNPEKKNIERKNNLIKFSHLASCQLAWLLKHARLVVCRPGYSGLMDLSVFGQKAILIPTPGQTEQEYLGQVLHAKQMAFCVRQGDFDLKKHLPLAEFLQGIRIEPNHQLLNQAVDELFSGL